MIFIKRLITSFLLIGIIIVICIVSNSFLNNFLDDTITNLNQIEKNILENDFDSAINGCKRIFNEYKSKENFLVASMHHDDLEKIPATVKECEILLKYSDEPGIILAELKKLKVALDDIKETNNISLYSLM